MKLSFKALAYLAAVAHALTLSALAEEPSAIDSIIRRGLVSQGETSRLKAVFERARRGEDITVAAVGGSITAGGLQTQDPENRYIRQVAKWFEVNFPKAKIRFVNAGIGGTNSFYGAMRLQRDVLAKNPDLVIVEWAVNNLPGKDFAESYEGVLRQLLRSPRNIAVIELFFMHKDGENAQMWQEILGRHYGLPMVSFRDAWFPEFTSGRAQWDDLYADVVHPKDAGHLLAGQLLVKLLETSLPAKGASTPITEIPPSLISNAYENCVFSIYETLKPVANTGWEHSADQKFWESGNAGDSIEFEFTGKSLFLGYDFDKDQAPEATFSIDGGKQQPLKADAHRRPIAADLSTGTHRIRIETQRKGATSSLRGKLKVWGLGGAEAVEPKY
jgi:hypothetical protein